MRVKELIEKLELMNPNAEIKVRDPSTMGYKDVNIVSKVSWDISDLSEGDVVIT